MADDWENVVIETGVDTLLDYLAENQEATVSQISNDLGVSEKRIKKWAEALEDNQFVERTYSARKGMILHYTKSTKQNVDRKLEEVKQDVEEETSRINNEMEDRRSEIKTAKKQLKEMTAELEDNREKEEEVKQDLEKLEDLEEKIERKLEENKEKEERLHSQSVTLLSQIDNALNRIDTAEDKAETFEKKEHEVRKKIKALKKLERHSQNVDELDTELKELEEKEETATGVFSSFKQKIGSIFGSGETVEEDGFNYEELLEGTVEEVKRKMDNTEGLDMEKVLEKERQGEDRKTLKNYIKGEME